MNKGRENYIEDILYIHFRPPILIDISKKGAPSLA